MSTRSALVRNAIAAGLGQASNILARLVQIPFLLYVFGVEQLGVWMLIYGSISIVLVANVGFGSITGNELSLAIARGDRREAGSCWTSGSILVWSLTFLVVSIGGSLTIVLPWNLLLGLPDSDANEISLCLAFIVVAASLNLPLDLFSGRLRAARQNHVWLRALAVRPWLENGFMWTAGMLHPTLSAMAFSVLLASAFFLMVCIYLSGRYIKDIRLDITQLSWSSFRRMGRLGLSLQGLSLGNAINQQGLNLVVNYSLGSSAVAVFSTLRMLIGILIQTMSMINNITWPEFSIAIGQANFARVRRLLGMATALNVTVVLFGSAFLLTFGPWFYSFWTSGTLSVPLLLLAILLIPDLLTAIYTSSATLLYSCNMHSKYARNYILFNAIAVGVSFYLCEAAGLHGAALSTAVPCLMLVWPTVGQAIKICGMTRVDFLRSVILEYGAMRRELGSRFF